MPTSRAIESTNRHCNERSDLIDVGKHGNLSDDKSNDDGVDRLCK